MRITRRDPKLLILAGLPEGVIFPVMMVLFSLVIPAVLSFTIAPKLIKNPASTLWVPAAIAAFLSITFLVAGIGLLCRRQRLTLDLATGRALHERWNAITSRGTSREFRLDDCRVVEITTRVERTGRHRGMSGEMRLCTARLELAKGAPVELDKTSNARDERVRGVASAVAEFLSIPLRELDQAGAPDEDSEFVEQPTEPDARRHARPPAPRPELPTHSRIRVLEDLDAVEVRWRLLRSGCVVIPLTFIALGFALTATMFLLAISGTIRSNIPTSGPGAAGVGLGATILLAVAIALGMWSLAMRRAENVVRVTRDHVTREIRCPYALITRRFRALGNPLARHDSVPRSAITGVRVVASSDQIELRAGRQVISLPLFQADKDTLNLAADTLRWAIARD